MNSFGNIYRLTSFGESHGPAMGGVIDGMPAGVMIGREDFDKFMARRSPGGRVASRITWNFSRDLWSVTRTVISPDR